MTLAEAAAAGTDDLRSVYLQEDEVDELLHLLRTRHTQKKYSAQAWTYAAVTFALCTGARRSSVMLAEVRDINWKAQGPQHHHRQDQEGEARHPPDASGRAIAGKARPRPPRVVRR